MIRKIGTPQLILILLGSSALFYLIQILIFGRFQETGFYFFQDLAFVPISVLLVTLGLNTVMVYRERQAKLEKVGIVVNEFFAEAGVELIMAFRPYVSNIGEIAPMMQPAGDWQDKDFYAASAFISKQQLNIEVRPENLEVLLQILEFKKPQILHLFENANLLEHDRFTDMLWSVYHVYDELRSRPAFGNLPASDILHLCGDLQRAVLLLFVEWIDSMRALKKHYPYLYSLAIRKNPLGSSAIIIEEG